MSDLLLGMKLILFDDESTTNYQKEKFSMEFVDGCLETLLAAESVGSD